MKFEFVRFSDLTSTNDEAKKYASEGGPLPALIMAERQSAGRGRLGRSFYSSDNTGLYMTLVFKAPDDDGLFLRLTCLAAVCSVESIRELFGLKAEIKWVNDIFLYGKKAGGILAESFFVDGEKYVAIGFGINLYTDFPDELKDIAISLFGSYTDSYTLNTQRNALANRIAEKFLATLEHSEPASCIEKYRSFSCVLGNEITFVENGISYDAFAYDIDSMGYLYVRLTDGSEHVLSSGEISLRIK